MNNKKMYNLFLISLVFFVYFLVTLGLYIFQRNLLYHPMENNYSGDKLTVKIEKVKIITEDKIDLLVNSAYDGFFAMTPHFGKPFWERPISVYDSHMDVGVRSSYVMSKLVIPSMVKEKNGLIVQISSYGGFVYFCSVQFSLFSSGSGTEQNSSVQLPRVRSLIATTYGLCQCHRPIATTYGGGQLLDSRHNLRKGKSTTLQRKQEFENLGHSGHLFKEFQL